LFSKERLEEKTLEAVFSKIQEHHDALRMVYREEGGKIIQVNQELDYPLHWHVFDYRGRSDARAALKEQMEIFNKSMDLAGGPLMKIALFHLDDGDYLSIIIHHLVVDGISWRILLEDIDTLFRQYREGKALILPLKTGSFKEWAEKLTEYAGSESLLAEKSYWERMNLVPVPALKRDFDQEKNEVKDMVKLSFQLDERETRQLLSAVHYAFHTEINDILLTALGMALKSVFGQRRFAVSLEGHGREELFSGFNINRTIGWFTTIYPVILNCPDTPGLDRAIKEIKETLHRVPNKGIGFGILNHLTAGGQKETNGFKLKPQISFNYLGEFEGGSREEGQSVEKLLWASGEELITNSIGLDEQRRHDLDISGSVTNKRLNMTIMYNPGQYREETVKALWNHYEDQLRQIISFCITREKPELTPCDLTYKNLSIEKVEQLSTQYEVEDIYALSPMQSGMLFSYLKEGDSTVYFEQMSYRLEGEFDIQIIEKALEALFKRHQILRTVFINEGLKEPLQVVLKAVNVPGAFCFEDLRRLSCDEEKNSFIREYKKQDIQRSFNLSKDILCRLALFRIMDRKYEFAWSFHHILLDGWSVGILNSEFFQYYSSIANGWDAALPTPSPYRNYIEWLQRVDKDASRSYWRNYLEGCQKVTGIPQRMPRKTRERIYKSEEVILILEEAISIGLKQLAGKYHVTLNTVIQAVWGVILGKYNNTRDVVFGTVVSGRPPQIKGIESMVGLFLNTIPVRIRFEKDTAFHSLLTEIQQRAAAGEPYHYLSLAEIQAQSVLKNDLPDHILVFENYPMEEKLAIGVGAGKISEIESFEQVNYDFHIMIIPGSRLKIILKYNSSVFQRIIIERVGHHLTNSFSQVLDCETIEIEKIKFFEEGEKQKLLNRFNDDLDNE
jgi:iturin family lipopeptide synthetase C